MPILWCSTSLVLVQYLKKSCRELLKGLSVFKVIKKEQKKAAYDSLKVDDFEKCWMKMVVEHGLQNNEWLTSLYENRHLWVPAFLKHTFWAGMSISQRGSTIQTMGSELCISDSALIKAEVEEKGNGGGADLRKRKIGTEVEEDVNEEEEENDDDDENESAYEKLNKEDFICEIEGEDEGTGEGTGEGTESDTDSHSDSDFVNEDDKKAYMKYSEEFRSSNGFDIENYYVRPPGGKFVLGFLSRMDPGSGLDKYCEKAVKNVLKFQNLKNNTNLQYVKIIKANVRGPGMYFVTFEAEDTISRTVKVYQSQVYRSPGSGNTTIFLFREKHG